MKEFSLKINGIDTALKQSENLEDSLSNVVTQLDKVNTAEDILKAAVAKANVTLEAQMKTVVKLRQTFAELLKSKLITISEVIKKQNENYSKHIDDLLSAYKGYVSQLKAEQEKEIKETTAKYAEVEGERKASLERITAMEDKAKNARGARVQALQEQVNMEMMSHEMLASQSKKLEKDKKKAEDEKAKLEKRENRIAITQGIVKSTASVALGVTQALTMGLAGIPIAAIIGAIGAIQIATQMRQLRKLEKGGLLKGKRHADGGMRIEGSNVEVEGGEFVVNRRSTDRNMALISYINAQQRELNERDMSAFFASKGYQSPFRSAMEGSGHIPIVDTRVNVETDAVVDAIRAMKFEPKVAVTDIIRVQDSMVKVDSWAGI